MRHVSVLLLLSKLIFLYPAVVSFEIVRREAAEIVVHSRALVRRPLYDKHLVFVILGEYSADLGGGVLPCREASLEHDLLGIGVVNTDTSAHVVEGIVAGIDLLHLCLKLIKADGKGSLAALDIAVSKLFIEIVVHDGIRELRPTVEEIPPDDAGLSRSADSDALAEVFLSLCLTYLRGAAEVSQVIRNLTEKLSYLIFHKDHAVLASVLIGGVENPLCVILIGP